MPSSYLANVFVLCSDVHAATEGGALNLLQQQVLVYDKGGLERGLRQAGAVRGAESVQGARGAGPVLGAQHPRLLLTLGVLAAPQPGHQRVHPRTLINLSYGIHYVLFVLTTLRTSTLDSTTLCFIQYCSLVT